VLTRGKDEAVLRDRRTIDTRRPIEPYRRGSQSQPRVLLFAIGLFVVMLLVVGALLMTGGDDPAADGDMAGAVGSTPSGDSNTTGGTPSPESDGARATEVAQSTPPAGLAAATASITAATATAGSSDASATQPPDGPATEQAVPTVELEATEQSPPDEAPTEEPVIGEFGELPPPQLVSGGLARPLTLQYQLDVSLATAPTSAPVYLLLWPDWSVDGAAALAASLGIDGEVVDQGGGSYQASGSTGDLFIAPGVVQYISGVGPPDGTIDNDGSLIATARQWLLDTGLVGADVGDGSILGRDEASQRAVVAFKPIDPSPMLAFVPSATVTLGPGGVVREANVRWPDNYAVSDYGLRSVDELWNEVLAGEGAIEADLTVVPGEGALTGTLTVHTISIAYSYAGSPAGDEYLVPLMVFSGDARLGEFDLSVPVSIYLPAVFGQAAPRG
jgi:hypothetical protein